MFGDFDDGSDYEQMMYEERAEIRIYQKERLSKVSNDDLLLKYLAEARNSEEIKTIVEGGNFPAFDIAMRIKENKWTPTPKQREALENVLAFYYIDH